MSTIPQSTTPASFEAFTFGDPVPVLDQRELMQYAETAWNGRWYEPPISVDGLDRAFRSAVHHASAIIVKRNILSATFVPHRLLSRADFKRCAFEYIVFGNAYLERVNAIGGRPMRLRPSPAKHTRRAKDDRYLFLHSWHQEHEFAPGSICHLIEPDLGQEIYGVPEYLAGLQSAFLNESATLFRRRYYLNGSHAGFILYINDAIHSEQDVDAIRNALKNAKGPGNFRNLFLYSPNGKKDGVQLIPISEVAAKDEFIGIKSATRDDMLAAHRVPPQLLGVMPNNASGLGDITKAAAVFAANELKPLQSVFQQVNQWIGEEVIRFEPYSLEAPSA